MFYRPNVPVKCSTKFRKFLLMQECQKLVSANCIACFISWSQTIYIHIYIYIQGFSYWGKWGESYPHLQNFHPRRLHARPHQVFIPPPLSNNFQVITQKNSIFSCSNCYCSIIVLISHSLDTEIMSIFILTDVQYSQKAVFSFQKGSNRQDYSSSGSLHLVKNPPSKISDSPHNPLALFGRPKYIKVYGPFLWKGCNCPKAIQSHYEETVYFLPEIPGTH